MTSAGSGRRRAELAENLTALRARVATACEAAGRDVGEISVVAVTKTWPASDVRLLAEFGVSDIGENRDQEAAPKAAECADLALTWHFVGQIQTNKCRSVVGYADVVQSVDRPRLARVLAKEARRAGRVVTCLVQVDLDDEGRADRGGAAPTGQRGGVRPDQAPQLARQVAAEDGLRLGGVMAVAPLGARPREAFRRLEEVAAEIRAMYPAAGVISAGMSGDLEEAIASGATHLRVGTALLGVRRVFVR